MIAASRKDDSLVYAAIPPGNDEFPTEEEALTRGESRWYTFRHPDERRPVLVLTRNEVIERLNEIIVVPATRTIRGLATELILTPGEGMPVPCALNFDHVALAQRERIGAVLPCLKP